ncbi:MAG: nitrate transporter substrate-binding protein [Actinomycetia bacterium]|nr:nitrate transporter substrate-binding protein [Actinomycetes bacterium]
MKRPMLAVVGALALLGALSGCGSGGGSGAASSVRKDQPAKDASTDAKPLETQVKVRFGLLPNVNGAPLYLAQAKGYFEEENLAVEIVNAGTLVDAQPLLATGRLDAVYGGAAAAFFNSLANGGDVKYVAGAGQSPKGGPASAIVALADAGIKDAADLKGKKIGTPGGNAGISAFYVSKLLAQADLTIADVTLVNLGLPDGLAALTNGAVDAAISSGPLLTQALDAGTQVIVGDMDKVLESGNGGGFIFGPTLLKSDRRAGVAVLRALLRATRQDLQGDYLQDPAIVQTLATDTQSPVAVIENTPPPTFDRDLKLKPNVFQEMQTFWRGQKVITNARNLTQKEIYDGTLLQLALASMN